MKKLAAVFLIVLAIAMLYLGITNSIYPPSITGLGFIAIAVVFLREKK